MQRNCNRTGKTSQRRPRRMVGWSCTILLPIATTLGLLWNVDATADDVPPSRLVVIVMRAIAYDGNLKSRAGETINVAVMHKKGNTSSEQMASVMARAFGKLQSTLVSGLPIVVTQLPYSGPEGLRKTIAGAGIDLLYVCDGLDGDVDTIKDITRRSRVLSVGAKREYVEKGLSFGVFEIDGKSTILLNLQASRLEGVSFASDLLRLVTVIR